MYLDAKTYQSILKALRADRRKFTDRRNNPRAGLSAKITIKPLVPGAKSPAAIPAKLRDLSVSGLGLLCNAALNAGDLFVVELPRHDGTQLAILCKIVHERSVSGRFTQISAKLEKELSGEELKRISKGQPIELEPAAV